MDEDLAWYTWARPDHDTYVLTDHFGQFDNNFKNKVLDQIPPGSTVYTEYLFSDEVKRQYPDLDLRFSAFRFIQGNQIYQLTEMSKKFQFPPIKFPGFLSSFNRSNQAGRHWLLAHIIQNGWYDPQYCTKHFELDPNIVAEIGIDLGTIDPNLVTALHSQLFSDPTDAVQNLGTLSLPISKTFCHIVSETITSNSTAAFPTEKFLYPIACDRLWLAYAPPWYHKMIHQQFGFELYPCFDYAFDSIWEPRTRLQTLIDELKKFSSLTADERLGVYHDCRREIEHNKQHLKRWGFFKQIVRLDEVPGDCLELFAAKTDNQAAWEMYLNFKQHQKNS